MLYLAVATGIGLGTTILNNVRNVRRWHQQTMVGDFFLTTLSANPLADLSAAIPLALGDEVRAVPGVTNVAAVRLFTSQVDDHLVLVIAADFAAAPPALGLGARPPEAVARQLAKGDVVVGATMAQRRDCGRATAWSCRRRAAPRPADCRHGRLHRRRPGVCMEWSLAQRLFGIQGADMFAVQRSVRSPWRGPPGWRPWPATGPDACIPPWKSAACSTPP